MPAASLFQAPIPPFPLFHLAMIIPLLIAIWFGRMARKAGRSALGWGLVGAALAVADSFLVSRGIARTWGPVTLDELPWVLGLSALLSTIVTIAIGLQILPRRVPASR